MADPVPTPAKGGGKLSVLTKKYGPLPGYAYVLIIAGGYFLYTRYLGGGSSGTSADGSATAPSGTYSDGVPSGSVSATPSAPGRTIYGYGKNGTPFYSLAAYDAALAKASKGARKVYGYGKGGKPFYSLKEWRLHEAQLHASPPVGTTHPQKGGGSGKVPKPTPSG